MQRDRMTEEEKQYLEKYDLHYDSADEILITVGASEGIDLALRALVDPGDEVLVQSFTFCASSHPITYLGATPVFVDSEPETWNMDPEALEKAFEKLDILRITGSVFGENEASKKVLTKAGFKLEGVMRNAVYKNNRIMDLYHYGLYK